MKEAFLSPCCFFRVFVFAIGFSLAPSFAGSSWAYVDAPDQAQQIAKPDNPTAMNGYTLKQFGDFIRNWHFVTVRFRRDTGEQRLIYANDSAWKALLAGSKDYPDGAVFAKIGAPTDEDPAFIDSQTPMSAKRVQFMVRNHEKHKDTDGWGYAVFNVRGFVNIGEPQKNASEACNACHQVVRDRGMIFSKPMPALRGVAHIAEQPPSATEASSVAFITMETAALPEFVRAHVPPDAKQVRVLQGPIPQHVFHGTVYESMPLVAAEAVRAKMPAVLIGQSGTPEFTAVWPAFFNGYKSDGCKIPGGKTGRTVLGGHTITYPSNPIETRYRFQLDEPYCSPTAAAAR
jgi:hypothetical protein